MWTELRKDIDKIKREKKFPDQDFRELAIDQWKEIEGKIYQAFCKLEHPKQRPIWLWEHFKLDTYSHALNYAYAFDSLLKLIDSYEYVWLVLNESTIKGGKLWFYNGRIDIIVSILKDSTYTDEVYIVSKQFEWIICINHHDNLIASGKPMSERLRNFQSAL